MSRLFYFTCFIITIFSFQVEAKMKFRFPISNQDRNLIAGLPIVGMDHDHLHGSNKAVCENYRGASAPFCYNGHRGTDFLLIGGFHTMDRGSAEVVAAASGVVEKVIDGNYDRCRADFRNMNVTCNGHRKAANYVVIRHKDGTKTRYLHLKKKSIRVREGQRVACGQVLGLVGSSGNSSMPHLHFEVIENGDKVDPYAGRNSQKYSYWHKAFELDGLPSGSCKRMGGPRLPTPRCTWQTIQDGARCGYESVTNALACGVETIQDAALCGQQLVKCGTKTVKDAVKCGTKVVTSAAQCGTDFLGNIAQCLSKGLDILNGGCRVPKSCSVAKTCQIDLMCNQAKTCTRPKTCEIPRTCQINSCKPGANPRRLQLLRFE